MMDLSKATCATCPFYEMHGCRLGPKTRGEYSITWQFPLVSIPDKEWCSHHPIRRAAYELAVQAAKEAGTNG